jgi:hypothetical protein
VVNFRFHLVSLTAVFLALAVGIGLGATVVDQATVEALERRLNGVEERIRRTDGENVRLQRELDRWTRFSEEAGNEAVAGRLVGLPVVVVAVQGVDRGVTDAFRQTLVVAGARFQGTIWLTSKLNLEKPQDAVALAELLDLEARTPEAVKRASVEALARAVSGQEPGRLVALRDAGFLDFEAQVPNPPPLPALAVADTRFAILSSADADVPNEQLAIPLTAGMARLTAGRVLAAEPGKESQGREPSQRALFVGPLRENGDLNGLLSTVDDLEDFRGRFAAVSALRDLFKGKSGHFGVGPRAARLVPESAT